VSAENVAIVHDSAGEVHASVLDVIARAASDPSVNVEKLERLLAIQERLLADQRKTAYFAALARLQAALPQITKAGTILDRDGKARNRYAKIEDIDVAIRPLCAAEGFSFSFDSKANPAGAEYSCAMAHRDGHVETKTLTLPLDQGAGRNAVQSAGSSISYAKRYLLGMHLHLVTRDEDDDGNGREPITPEQAEELRVALADAGGSEARFLMFLGADTFEGIRGDKLGAAKNLIAEKKRQKAPRSPIGHP
jgi:hypothetical protein